MPMAITTKMVPETNLEQRRAVSALPPASPPPSLPRPAAAGARRVPEGKRQDCLLTEQNRCRRLPRTARTMAMMPAKVVMASKSCRLPFSGRQPTSAARVAVRAQTVAAATPQPALQVSCGGTRAARGRQHPVAHGERQQVLANNLGVGARLGDVVVSRRLADLGMHHQVLNNPLHGPPPPVRLLAKESAALLTLVHELMGRQTIVEPGRVHLAIGLHWLAQALLLGSVAHHK